MKGRRSFLKGIGAVSIGLSTPVVGATRATVNVFDALEKYTSNEIVDKKKGSDNCRGIRATSEQVFQGSDLRILNVFKESTYGWQAHVGLNSAAGYVRKRGDKWVGKDSLNYTTFKAVNSTSKFDSPDPTEGFRGFEQHAGSDGDPKLPAWVEPAFDIAGSSAVSLATSNPWTGVAAGALLGLNNLADSLQKDDGKHSIDNGVKVTHTQR
ncbi:hypothetical protein [Halorhabdus rudnickae]|uniref:hypothetical protein n=1 Tax=Halorhabdus rudnickae TaxID=1775544 RepID=UPI0010838097|nr:hypothetical protein [Halorhabdus rudnickae]